MELASAYVSILPSLKGFQAPVRREFSGVTAIADQAGKESGHRFATGVSSAIKGLAVGALVGVAFSKVTSYAKSAVSVSSDLSETVNKSSVIFGKNASVIDRWSNNSVQKLGLSKGAAIEAAAGYGDMFKQIGFSGKAATQMSKSTVKLATDLGSFNNLPTAEVNDMIAASFRGEYDSLQRVIPNINAARVQTKALSETGKSNAASLTAQEKAHATLSIIQKDGARAQGDFARTSGGLANSQKILSAAWEDGKAKIGQALIPAVTVGTQFLTNVAVPAFVQAGVAVSEFLGKVDFTAFTAQVKSIDMSQIGAQIAKVADGVKQIIPAVTEANGQMPDFVQLFKLGGAVLGFMADHVDLVIKALPFLAAGFLIVKTAQIGANIASAASPVLRLAEVAANRRLAASNVQLIAAINGSTASITGNTVANGANSASTTGGIGARLRAIASMAATKVAQLASAAATGIATAAQWAWNAAMTANPIGIVIVAIAALVAGIILLYNKNEAFRNLVTKVWEAIKTAIGFVVNWIQATVVPFLQKAWGYISAGLQVLWTVYSTVWKAIFNVVWTVVQWIAARILPVLQAAWGVIQLQLRVMWTVFMFVFNAIKTVVVAVVGYIVTTVVPFLQAAWTRVSLGLRVLWAAASVVFNAIKSVVVSVVSAIVSFVIPKFNTLRQGATVVFNAIKQVISGAINQAKTVLSSIGAVIGTVVGFFGRLLSGVKSKLGGVTTLIAGIPGKILGFFSGAATMLLTIGKNIVQGLIDGIRSMASAVVTALIDLLPGPLKAFADKLGIHSPSKLFKGFGRNITEGLVEGIDKGADAVKDAVNKMADVVKSQSQKKFKPGAASKSSVVAYINKQGDLVRAKAQSLTSLQSQLDDTINGSTERNITGLNDLKKTRDDFINGIKDTALSATGFLGLASGFTGKITIKSLQKTSDAAAAVAEQFTSDIQSLAGRISDEQLKSLTAAGAQTAGAMTHALATASPQELANLNAAQARMAAAASALGTFSNKQFFQAGIDTAQGIADGLAASIVKVAAQGKQLAKALIDAVKKQLKIKSPSRVFTEIGGNVGQGLTNGIAEMAPKVSAATMALVPDISTVRSVTPVGGHFAASASTFQPAPLTATGPSSVTIVDADGKLVGSMRVVAAETIDGLADDLIYGNTG